MERWSQHLAKKKQNGTGPQENKTKPVPRKTSPSFPIIMPYSTHHSTWHCIILYCLNVFRTHHYSSCRMFRCCESISVSVFQTECFQSSQEGYSQQRGKYVWWSRLFVESCFFTIVLAAEAGWTVWFIHRPQNMTQKILSQNHPSNSSDQYWYS